MALFSIAFWVLVLALWLDVRFVSEVLSRISTNAMYVHVDFHTFWHSAAALLEGRDVYDTDALLENLNPPFWILLISPLGLLEPLLAYRIFALITLGITAGYLIWMADEVRLRSWWAVVAVVMLLLSSPLLATLALGQIYPVLALGLVAAWIADRRESSVLSGTSLGLSGRSAQTAAARPRARVAARAAAVEGVRGGTRLRRCGDARRGGRGRAGGDARLVEAAIRPGAQPVLG